MKTAYMKQLTGQNETCLHETANKTEWKLTMLDSSTELDSSEI
jgi:hypothetical protein